MKRMFRRSLQAVTLLALRGGVNSSSMASNAQAQSDDATTVSKRAKVYEFLQDPLISDFARAHLPDSQVSSLFEFLRGIEDIDIAGHAGLHVTSEELPPSIPTAPASLAPFFPCSYYGVMPVVTDLREESNSYNTEWGLPLDLRETTDWASFQSLAEADITEICGLIVPNKEINRDNLTAESCAQHHMHHIKTFVGAMCRRAEDRSALGSVESTLSTSNSEKIASSSCVNPTPFDAICRLAGTDKSSHVHGFAAFYDQQISRMRAPPAAILELGVFRGASLGAWAAKFPCADVLGLDAFVWLAEEKVYAGPYTVSGANQEDPASLLAATAGRSFDLIIDDGGHSMRQQQNTMQALWPKVRPCGLFIMEDLHTSIEGKGFKKMHDFSPTTLDLMTGLVPSNASELVDFGKILSEAVAVELYRPSDDHITAVIHKRC